MTRKDRVVANAILRTDLQAFVQRSFRTLNPGTAFLPNWHVEALAHHLELVRTGKIRRLLVNIMA